MPFSHTMNNENTMSESCTKTDSTLSHTPSLRLFVTKVPRDCTKQELITYFGQYGELDQVVLPMVGGRAKGIADVSYKCPETCHGVSQLKHAIRGNALTVVQASSSKGPGSGVKHEGYVWCADSAEWKGSEEWKSMDKKWACGNSASDCIDTCMNGSVDTQNATESAPKNAMDSNFWDALFAGVSKVSEERKRESTSDEDCRKMSSSGSFSCGSTVPSSRVHSTGTSFASISELDRTQSWEPVNRSWSSDTGTGSTHLGRSTSYSLDYPKPYGTHAGSGHASRNHLARVDSSGKKIEYVEEETKIFVTKVGSSLTKQHIVNYFGQFGPLQDVFMPNNKDPQSTGYSHKGIAFVSFVASADAETVLQRGPTYEICPGQFIVVDRAKSRTSSGSFGRTTSNSSENFGRTTSNSSSFTRTTSQGQGQIYRTASGTQHYRATPYY